MWNLISVKHPEKSIQLLIGKVYTLGRMNCDIIEAIDKSISRKHAEFQVTHPEGNLSYPHKPPILTVKDLSKFGTMVQNQKLDGGSKVVNNGELIKFGTMDTVYRAVYEPTIVTTSCLDNQAKKDLKSLIGQLGGHVISEWRKECSLLVMSNISVTVKVICALIQQKPIVTVKYISDLINSINAGTKNPDPEEYAPPLTETLLNPREVSFKKNPDRATLFEGKTFLFISTKQFKRLNVVVELAGGKPKLIEEGTDDDDDSILVAPGTVVMQFDTDDASQNISKNAVDWAKHVQDVLQANGRRMIADSELGYAILYCSTSRYCNPNSSGGAPSGAAALPSQSLSARPDISDASERIPVASPAPVRIKEEPMSQASERSNQRSTRGNTRGNLEVSRVQDTESEVPEKSQRTPCPPSASKRKRTENDDEENVVRPKTKRGPLIPETPERRSPSPKRSRGKASQPEVLASESFVSKSQPRAVVKEEVDDLFDEFEATTSRRRGGQRSKQNETPARKARSEVKNEVDDLFDEFDDISSTRRRRKVVESQAQKDDDGDDDEFDTSSRRKRKRNNSTTDQKKPQQEESDITDMEIGSGDSPAKKRQKETNSTRKPSPKPKRNQSPSPAREPAAVKMEVANTDTKKGPEAMAEASSNGYISKSRVNDAVKSDIDTSLPVGLVQQEFASLVIRKPGSSKNKARQSQTLPDGMCVWKGKPVKNFKKFRKTPAPGSEGLPRIIGGNDLIIHNRSQRRDLDEWFEHVVEEETERDEMEKMAEKMFNYEPSRRTSKR